MSFGIIVRNESFNTQIDSTYTAFRVVNEGHTPVNQAHPVPAATNQILMVRPSGGVGVVGSVWLNNQFYASSPNGIDWVLMQLQNTIAPANTRFGLRIFSPAGLVYDSGSRVLCPQANGVFDGNMSTARAKVYLPSAPLAGRRRFVEWSFLRRGYGLVYDQGSGLPFGRGVMATAEFDHTGVSVGLELGPNSAPVNAPPSRAIIKFMVADV